MDRAREAGTRDSPRQSDGPEAHRGSPNCEKQIQKRSQQINQFWTTCWTTCRSLLGIFWGASLGPTGANMRPRAPSKRPNQHNFAFTETVKHQQFSILFGVPGPPRQPRNGQENCQEAPKELQILQKNDTKNRTFLFNRFLQILRPAFRWLLALK